MRAFKAFVSFPPSHRVDSRLNVSRFKPVARVVDVSGFLVLCVGFGYSDRRNWRFEKNNLIILLAVDGTINKLTIDIDLSSIQEEDFSLERKILRRSKN